MDSLIMRAGPAGIGVLVFSAALEYIFPPFPGDTVILFGGVLAVRGNLPALLVFVAIMAGSLLGASFDYAMGRWIGRGLSTAPANAWYLRKLKRGQIMEWEERFRRRGVYWLSINRFLPGVRGFIFLMAGISRIPFVRVLFWGGLSALAWNGLLFTAGYGVGGQADRLEILFKEYGRISWAVLGTVAVVFAARLFWKKLRPERHGPE